MVGDRMAGSPLSRNQGAPPGASGVHGRKRPEEPPGGSQSVRSSDEVPPTRDGAKGRRKVEGQGNRTTTQNRRQWQPRLNKSKTLVPSGAGGNVRSGQS